jgi:hypothetical protein
VFRAWIAIDEPELPDNINDMRAHTSFLCKRMKHKDPQLCALSDQEILRIINTL